VRRVEVVVLNWNGAEDTTRCLESLRAAAPPPGAVVRLRVVDNGSQDGSRERIPGRFPDVAWQGLPENRRYAGGNNAGTRAALEAGADFVLWLNNDTVVDRDLLVDLLAEEDRSPEAGLWGPLVTDARGRVWYGGGGLSVPLGWAWHRGLGRRPPPRETPARETGYLTGCCLLVARGVFERIGFLDEGYYLYAEDADFCLRARRAGFRPRLVPRARVTHFVSSSSGGAANPFKAYHRTRAGLRLFARHARGVGRWTWPVGFLALLLAHTLAWCLRGAPSAAGAAWLAVWDAGRGTSPGRRYPAGGAARAA
jgi:hypothetical protein